MQTRQPPASHVCVLATGSASIMTSKTRLHRPLAAAALATLQSASLAAQAQDSQQPPQQLPKISVGAEGDTGDYKTEQASSPRYTEPLLDTPRTITVIPAAVIRDQGATNLRDVLRNSPGITFQAGEGGGGLPGDQNFSVRGFSSRNSLFIDGVRDTGAYVRDSFNLQQVEVIKGPNGTVSGRSATSGAINQVTKTPQSRDFQDYSLGFGTEQFGRATADINAAFGDSMALRVNAMYHESEVSNRDVAENQRWGFAPSLAIGLNGPTRFTLALSYLEEDNVPDYGLPWGTLTQTTAADPSHNGTFPTGAYDANPPVDQSNFYGLRNYDFEDVTSESATARLEHDFSDTLTLSNVTRYVSTDRSSAITAPRPPNRQLQLRDMDVDNITNLTDVTLRFDTGGLTHALVTGLELAREKTHNRNSAQTTNQPPIPDFYLPDPDQQPFGPMSANTGNPSETQADTAAVYLLDTISVGEHWQFSAGLRHDRAEIDFTSRSYMTGAVIDDLSRSEQETTYHAAVVYKPRDNGSLYIAYGTGFDPTFDAGAVGSGLSSAPGQANYVNLEPEKSKNLELGTKWDLLDGRLSLNAAIFRMEKTNVRTRTGTGGNTEAFVLDGEQRVDGVELSTSGMITEAWSIFAGVSYLDSEYKQSLNSLEQGQELALVPQESGNLWTTYVLPFGLTIGTGIQYVGEVVRTRTAALGEVRIADYFLVDAMASYPLTERTLLRLNATNIADEEYVDRVGGGHYVPGAGRTVSLTANFSF
jgi:catecholate siderophore receptor